MSRYYRGYNIEDSQKSAKKYISDLYALKEKNPELAKKKATDMLINIGVLNSDGTQKESIVNGGYLGVQ